MPEFAPGLVLIGSDGGDEALAIDTGRSPMAFVRVPFIGMSRQAAVSLGTALADLVEDLAS